MTAAPGAGTIRLMTWNIHGGVGPDRRFDVGRIAALVMAQRPDIVALQEIDTRGRPLDCLAPLGALGGGHRADARTIVAPDGHYGHALFSRWPITAVHLHDLSVRRREPRAAIEAEIATDRGSLRVIAVHLGLDIAERRRQAGALAAIAVARPDHPTVMLGDFNDWFSFGTVRRTLAAVLPERTMLRTFPARRPLLRLDRIYCDRPGALAAVMTDTAARDISDHLPVVADLAMAPPTAAA